MDIQKLAHTYEAWGNGDTVVEVTEADRAETDERFILALAGTQALPPVPTWYELHFAALTADYNAARQFVESVEC